MLPLADTTSHTRRETGVAWLFVAVQFLLLGVMVLYPRDTAWAPSEIMQLIGSALMVAGVVVGLWAAAYLGKGLTPLPLPNGATDLVTRGPYRLVRHPIYVSVMLLGAGITIRSGSAIVALAFVALVALFAVKARWEEMHLIDAFPGYERYMEASGRFSPIP
ncbi:MAG: isoprenylcysteine carboxylmethyltransferase family protein [Actinomycetota bacterium]